MSDTHKPQSSKSDLQSVNGLIVDSVISITSIVESMHKQISPLSRLRKDTTSPRGIAGLVYRNIYTVTALVGKALDTPLGLISKALETYDLTPPGDNLKAALNGILGDYLHQQQNSLAISMALHHEEQQVDAMQLSVAIEKTKGKLVLMIHGLCMNHLQWQREGHDHGQALAEQLDVTTAYLHYNSGLSIAENGAALSSLLEQLVLNYQAEHELEVSIVAHSMGGLVSRSAHHHATTNGLSWTHHLKNIVFLGTPHHGAPLERAGAWLDLLFGTNNYTSPLTRLSKFRSAGIHDLRHGNIVGLASSNKEKYSDIKDQRDAIALPQNVNCFAVATTVKSSNETTKSVLGDGLVPLDSALGRHKQSKHTLQFPEAHQWVGENINHMQLLSHPDVYAKIKHWLTTK